MFKGGLNKLKSNELIQVASVNSLSVLFKLITGFVTSKFTAIFIGPSGMAITGNLSNFTQSVENLSSLGFKNGIIKYVSEYKDDKDEFKKIVSSGFFIALSIGLLLTLILLVFSNTFSVFVFNTKTYSDLFRVLAFMVPLFSLQVFFIAIYNGLKRVHIVVLLNIIATIATALLIIYLMYVNQLQGALLAMVITPFVLFLTLFLKYKLLFIIFKSISIASVSKDFFLKIISFFSMTLFSGIMVPLVYLGIRNYVIDRIGVDQAGYWEGMRKISNYFMLFVFSLFQMYVLPELSKKNSRLKLVVFNFYKTALPVVLVCYLVIYFLRHFIIKIVLTEAFLPMQDLFMWQFIGDFFRIMFLVISYQFLAKKMVWPYIFCEAIYMLLIYLVSICFIDLFGIKGVVQAHALACFVYLLVLLFVFKKPLFSKQDVIQYTDYED
ncbi:O-antigen translocase [Pseudotamlana carrageenivorans]|uniref:O-antigen translocase n=1 Tax=Pseudotamlana carrageenivorans TaxID=2069432 RepID=A0A2I7SIZ6_9FLAO|nr:O-antigen translocase [Tamlana carrageenivorans]AUS05872.1 O-antigen translocase [Tamlana carrageenivorans]